MLSTTEDKLIKLLSNQYSAGYMLEMSAGMQVAKIAYSACEGMVRLLRVEHAELPADLEAVVKLIEMTLRSDTTTEEELLRQAAIVHEVGKRRVPA